MYRQGPRSFLTLLFIVVLATWASVQFRFIGVPGNDWHDAINSDGKGYYEYLRLFLFPEGHPHISTGNDPEHTAPVIKHFGGAALFMAPFVLVAHGHTLFNTGQVEDGYSLHYQVAVGMAAIFFLLIGLLALRRLLLDCGIPDGVVSITLLVITLGTGLVTQVVVHPAMSHVYGFATIALLLLRARALVCRPTAVALIICAALLGLATWVRPVNFLVVLALPLAAFNTTWNKEAHYNLLRSRWMFIAGALFVGIISLQGLLWFKQSGSFLVRPYPGEGFHWRRPAIANNLFGPRNGLFFYWPLLLLVVPGAVLLWRCSRRLGYVLLLFLVAFIYVTAAWWNWAYGDNFGQRTYVDMLAVIALPIALAIPRHRRAQRLLLVLMIPLVALNLFQSWQYLSHRLVTGQMDWPKYWHIFLRTDPEHIMKVGGHEDLPLYSPHGMRPLALQFSSRPSDDETLVLSAPLEAEAMEVPLFFEMDLERTEFIAGSSADARVGLRLRRNGSMRAVYTWRMNVVPDAPATAQWHYAFNVFGQEPGDTLDVVLSEGGTAWHAKALQLQGSVPR